MTPTVFISSTYEDLIPYRKSVWDVLSDLNLTIKGMEKFGARKSCPLDTCLAEVSKSDIYIGILAYRFGSIESKTGKSFTQLEYEKAVALDKNILIYLLAKDGNLQPRFVDFGEKALKLENFKNFLQEKHTVDFFKDPDDLKIKIYDKLKDIYPDFKNKFYHLKDIECRLTRFKIEKEEWVAFVGYYNKVPVEFYAGLDDEEIFPVPKSITKGRIVKTIDKKGYQIIWFQYLDRYGYEKSIGSLGHVFDKQIGTYCSIITKLLQEDIPFKNKLKIINDMDLHHIKNPSEWKLGVINSLNNNN
jgi:hypothetical protein